MTIPRRDVLKSLGAIGVASAFSDHDAAANAQSAGRKPAPKKPNILVFLTDDHGQWLQQAYGNSEVHTPNMTRLAASGVRMVNAFTTTPVCSPARASFFTGRMPSQHGIHDWLEEPAQASVPWLKGQKLISELLKDAGYHTGLAGKWHCGAERLPQPGFDFWFSYWGAQYPHLGLQNFCNNGTHITANGFQSPLFTDQAMQFIRDHYHKQETAAMPFFLFVSYTDTHSPHIQMPDELLSEYSHATFRDIPVEEFSPDHGTALIPVSKDAAAENLKKREYYASASSVDREVGKILDELESRGELANTVVVYTGDHGLNAGQHGIWEKGNATVPQNFLEESIRIACAISWPNGGIVKNLESNLEVNHCDLFATLLECAGVVPDAETAKRINSPGKSYLPQLRGEPQSGWRDGMICEYGNARMMRKDGYKLILRYPFQDVRFADELYDLRSDPRETVNLLRTSRTQYSDLVAQMTSEIDEFFAKYSVPGHSGLDMEHQPTATPSSPWIRAVEMKRG